MMNKSISFPYPILGINDDIVPELGENSLEIFGPDVETDKKKYIFEIVLNQNNTTIGSLIEMGKAEYVCELTCARTYIRKRFCSAVNRFNVAISRKEVQGEVIMSFFVVAKEAIKNYTNEGFNVDYQGYSFDLDKGDYLVVFPNAKYSVDIKYDKLFAAGSFMNIREKKDNESVSFNLSDDRIMIELPSQLFEQYRKFQNTSYSEIIHASIVYNALVYALYNIGDSKYTEKLWNRSIEYLFRENKECGSLDLYDQDQVYEIADKLLKNPYQRMFNRLESMIEIEKEE